MARCGCTRACTCLVSPNGAIIPTAEVGVNTDPGTRTGWRDNLVSGSGSPNNPYQVSWKDSLEFRPKATEFRYTGPPTYATQSSTNGFAFDPTYYTTPSGSPLFVWALSSPEDINVTDTGILFGVRVVLNTFGGSGTFNLNVFASFLEGDDGPTEFGGQGNIGTINPILTAVGYVSPIRAWPVASSGLVFALNVEVNEYPTTVTLFEVSEIRIWGIAL